MKGYGLMTLSYFDAHCDTLTTGELHGHVNLSSEAYVRRGQVFAVCADGEMQSDLSFFRQAVSRLETLPVKLCRTGEEVYGALENRHTAAILAIEGAECVGCNQTLLLEAHKLGARILGLTHNRFNGLTGTCREQCDLGLTAQGRAFVRCAAELGMILDLSHISDAAAAELLDQESACLIASHSNARAVCNHPRNLTDDFFRQLAERGGLCGINLYTPFLTEKACASLEDVYTHVEHFLELTPLASRTICLGCDFDGCDQLPYPVTASADLGAVYELFLRKNYPQTLIDQLFFENLCRFLRVHL